MKLYNHKNEKGQALVEFALIFPVFMLLLFAIIEFSRLWETTNVVTSAAREGVRVASVTAPSLAQVTSAANNILNASNINNGTVTVTGPNDSDQVIVTVSVNYVPITGNLIPGLNQMTITRQSIMRWEG